ncbi:hypothetical protein B0J14DRAFT_706627 [Halenospora varia]|nr:hypothetical protein B0J14DRAFT_706627 [Halenospora varia]
MDQVEESNRMMAATDRKHKAEQASRELKIHDSRSPQPTTSARNCFSPLVVRTWFLVVLALMNVTFLALAIAILLSRTTQYSDLRQHDCSEYWYNITGLPSAGANTTNSNSTTQYTYSLGNLVYHCPWGYMCQQTSTCIPAPIAPPGPQWTNFDLLSSGQYFVGMYLTTLIAVIFKMIWAIVSGNLRLMEPYYKMAQPAGASASDTVCLNLGGTFALRQTLNGRHAELLVASIATAFVTLSVPVASEAITFRTSGDSNGDCKADANGQNCHPYLYVSRGFAGILAVIAIINTVLISILARRQRKRLSGLFINAHSIAGTAALMDHPTVSAKLRDIPPDARLEQVQLALEGSNWKLASWYNPEGYGFVVDNVLITRPDMGEKAIRPAAPQINGSLVRSDVDQSGIARSAIRPRSNWARMLRIIGFFAVLAGVLTVVTYYRWTYVKDSQFEKFMDSQSTGLRFLWTTIALLISIAWQTIDCETRQQEPYQRLLHKPAAARDTILVTANTVPLTAFFANLRRRNFFPAFISLNAILSEVLTVVLGSVPYSSQTSYTGFKVSTYISQVILALMLIALVWLLLRPHHTLPRKPTNIAAVMMYLYGSSMVKIAQELSLTQPRRPFDHFNGLGSYSFQVRAGPDGKGRLVIDLDNGSYNA